MRHLPAANELVLKIVYCGPGMAGKSTNLAAVRRRLPADRLSELVTVDQHGERSVRFDWRADELGDLHGCRLRVEIHTIPGQSYYAATRRQLLVGVDGIVFVADSRREALDENIEAMNELLGNLRQLEIPDDLPIVLQYNKQDLPTAVPKEQLAPLLNPRMWPDFAASALQATGVAETLDAVLGAVRQRAAEADLPAQAIRPAANLWLLTCWRCQNMVDADRGDPGTVLPCPVCKSPMEVVDADHGITQAPSLQENLAEMIDSSRHALPAAASSTMSRHQPLVEEASFALAGFTLVKEIERTPLGTRLRIRESATGRTFRAFLWSAAALDQPGYREGLDPYVRLAAPVRHAALLPVVAYHPGSEQVVLVSDDPPGHQSLARILSRRKVIAPPQALALVRQIANALDEAARAGAVHGWLRPEVVLVDDAGGVLIDELPVPVPPRLLLQELAGESAGTEYFLAPEYLDEGARPDARTDMFLLGAILFRMLTGEAMVTGYNAHEALHRVVAGGARGLRDAQAGLSRELAAFHAQLVATDRRERFRSWREVFEALERFGGGAKRPELHLTRTFHRPTGATRRSGPQTVVQRRASDPGTTLSGRRRSAPAMAPSGRPRWVPVAVGIALGAVVVALVAMALRRPGEREAIAAPTPAPATPPTARPVAAAPAPVPASPAPAPTPAAPAAKTSRPSESQPAQLPLLVNDPQSLLVRRELLERLADLKLTERYGAALDLAARLPSRDEQEDQRSQILALHAGRRSEIEALLDQGVPTPRIGEALVSARTVWGMPGDEEWASTVMARASTRHLQGGANAPATSAVGQPAEPQATPTAAIVEPPADLPPLVVPPAVTALGQVVQALSRSHLRGAQAVPPTLPSGGADARALHRLIELWRGRVQTVTRVLEARSAKLRVPHPTTGELWDVAGMDGERLSITAPSGSSSQLAWSQIIPRVQARLWSDAVQAPGAGPVDFATAAVMAIIADDAAMAAVHVKRGRPGMIPELVVDLDLLLALNQRRLAADLLGRGLTAIQGDDIKSANEVLTDLRRIDRSSVSERQDIVTRLEGLVGSRVPVTTPARTSDSPLPRDLRERQAALRAAGWDPLGNAFLDDPAVLIPSGSGISAPVPPLAVGFSIGLAGGGVLRILPARSSTPLGAGISLTVPAETTFFSIRLTREGIAVVDATGKVLDQARTPSNPSHLILRATAELRLSAVPQPIIP